MGVNTILDRCFDPLVNLATSEHVAHEKVLRDSGCGEYQVRELLKQSLDDVENRYARVRRNIRFAINQAVAAFANRSESLVDARLLDADLHCDRLPVLLTTDMGKYVLKYGDITPWVVINEPLLHFTKQNIRPEILSKDGESWGWYLRSWVSPVRQGGDPGSQAFGLGVLCGLALYLNIVDLHFENYIITKDSAIPIDVECTLYQFPNVLSSFDVDFIGMVGPFGSDDVNGNTTFRQFSEPFIKNEHICFVREKKFTEHVLRDSEGRVCRLCDYLPSFTTGFREAVVHAKTMTSCIHDIVGKSDWLSRKLFRPTRFYRVLLSEMILYGSTLRNDILRCRMKFAGNPASFPSLPLFGWELKQLMSGNIPIFHLQAQSGTVWSEFRRTKTTVSTSPLSVWLEKVRLLTAKRVEACLTRLVTKIQSR